MIEAILELEDVIFQNKVTTKEFEVERLAKAHNLNSKDLMPYFDLFVNYMVASQNTKRTLQKRIIWTLDERLIIDYFVKNTPYTKTEKFKFLSSILKPTERTKESISFDYYNNVVSKSKQKELKNLMRTLSKKNSSEIQSGVSTLDKTVEGMSLEDETTSVVLDKIPEADLLSNLSVFIKNTQTLNDFNLDGFFQGMASLSNLAVSKVNNTDELESLKLKVKEQEELIHSFKTELENKNKNTELIVDEISKFEHLSSVDKVVQLKDFSGILMKLLRN